MSGNFKKEENNSGIPWGWVAGAGALGLVVGAVGALFATEEEPQPEKPQRRQPHSSQPAERKQGVDCCSICLDDMSIYIRCGHSHHKNCLRQWIQTCEEREQTPTCPSCREPIDPEAVRLALA